MANYPHPRALATIAISLALALAPPGCLLAPEDGTTEEIDWPTEEPTAEGASALAYSSVGFPVADVAGKTWYHAGGSPYHRPHGGYQSANDQYCLDLNLSGDADAGKTVKAITAGTVVQKSTSLGWVLLKSACNLTWNGQYYSTCYHGYMHMTSIPTALAVGSSVAQGATLGAVGNAGTTANHLHFCHYVASPGRVGDIAAGRNGFLESVDPGTTLGGAFTNLNLTSKVAVQYVDDQKSSGNFSFTKLGSGFATDSAYGLLDGMTYRSSLVSGSDKATYSFNLGVPASGEYGLWAFVPRNHGTASAKYTVYVNGVSKGTYTINQASYYDRFASILGYGSGQCGITGVSVGTTMNLAAGAKVRVEVPAAIGVSGKQIAYDAIYLVRRYADCNNVNK